VLLDVEFSEDLLNTVTNKGIASVSRSSRFAIRGRPDRRRWETLQMNEIL
jgi:hypothetical protein